MTSKERFRNACRYSPVDRPPVWMMRQAGRTLKEYLLLREKHTFWEMCKTPELAAEVTLQPLRRFPVDAAIMFSDILVIPDALGMSVSFSPRLTVSPPIRTKEDIKKLKMSGLTKRLGYVSRLLRILDREIGDKKAVLGFSGAPYTLACYMIEGGSSKNFFRIKEMMYHQPELFKSLMDVVSRAVTEYLLMQIDERVTAVQLFDTWAGELIREDYEKFVLPYNQRIISKLKEKNVPVIYYINGIGNLLPLVKQTGTDVIGVDWRLSLQDVRNKLGRKTIVQGNLDPTALFAPPGEIRKRVHELLAMTGGKGHIVNLGHGLIPETPIEGIEAFVTAVTEWRNGNGNGRK